MFLGKHTKSFICRRFLNSYTTENSLINHDEKGGDDNICALRTSQESHIYWKKPFHKNPIFLRFIADFETHNEIEDNRAACNKTTNIYKKKSSTQ